MNDMQILQCCVVVAVLRSRVNTLLDELKMTGWYRQIVTDCGSNAKGAFKRDHVWDWMRCACHLLHNVVEAGFKSGGQCSQTLAKAKAFVAHIHHSRKASERFNEKQRKVVEEIKRQDAAQAHGTSDESDGDETLEEAEVQPGVPGFETDSIPAPRRVYRLTSQVDTRWNSRCYMMERWASCNHGMGPLCFACMKIVVTQLE